MDAPLLRRQVHTGLLTLLDGSEEIVENILRFLRFRADSGMFRLIENATLHSIAARTRRSNPRSFTSAASIDNSKASNFNISVDKDI